MKRKSHKNKYADFSKREILDPIEETILREKAKEEREKQAASAPSRGTTVPLSGFAKDSSNKTQINVEFKNITSIVPSDPTSFGYGTSKPPTAY
jgi:hypothetical protein